MCLPFFFFEIIDLNDCSIQFLLLIENTRVFLFFNIFFRYKKTSCQNKNINNLMSQLRLRLQTFLTCLYIYIYIYICLLIEKQKGVLFLHFFKNFFVQFPVGF